MHPLIPKEVRPTAPHPTYASARPGATLFSCGDDTVEEAASRQKLGHWISFGCSRKKVRIPSMSPRIVGFTYQNPHIL
jgi:hypothetical protein